MDKCVLLVDNSNLFIGGRKYSARRKGVRPNGNGDEPSDPSWRLNFDALREHLASGREIHAAVMVGSGPSEESSVWDAARQSGFKVVVHDRRHEAEKAVDTELVARGSEIIATAEERMTLVLGSADLDFIPLVDLAHRHGWDVELCAFTTDYPEEGDLAQAVDSVRPLDEALEVIGRHEFEWPN